MKKKKKILFITTLLISSLSQAQHVKISEINISSGNGGEASQTASIEDFKKLAPNSSILAMDFSQFKTDAPFYRGMNNNINSFYSLQLGLTCSKMPKATFRVGISHFVNNGLLIGSGSLTETGHYDTLTSSQTGAQTIIDTSHTKYYNINYSSQQLRLDGAMIFRMFEDKRWSLHAGLGATIGFGYHSTTQLTYGELSYQNNPMGYGNYTPNHPSTYTEEAYKNKNALAASLYTPLGVDFRIGKKREFWMPFSIYAEMRPSLNLNAVSDFGMLFSPGMNTALGLRVKF